MSRDKPQLALYERLSIELRVNPLGLTLTTSDGKRYGMALTPAQGEGLGLALLANSSPRLSDALAGLLSEQPQLLTGEVAAAIAEEAVKYATRKRAARPAAFLEVN
jgi:uncharacterized protein (DUF697 family)